MGKLTERLRSAPPPKLYRIGEVVQYTELSRQTVHNYTVMGLIRESDWTNGGHRLYDESVFQRLALIEDLKRSSSLAQIRQILSQRYPDGAVGASGEVGKSH